MLPRPRSKCFHTRTMGKVAPCKGGALTASGDSGITTIGEIPRQTKIEPQVLHQSSIAMSLPS